jgi:dienelactone hydrolase
VLDCRCALAWLASRPEVDPDRLGMVGTSLGSFLTALTSANERGEGRVHGTRRRRAGGRVLRPSEGKAVREVLDAVGGKALVKRLIAPVDPITYAAQLKGKNLLMIAATHDDVVPAKAATALWKRLAVSGLFGWMPGT